MNCTVAHYLNTVLWFFYQKHITLIELELSFLFYFLNFVWFSGLCLSSTKLNQSQTTPNLAHSIFTPNELHHMLQEKDLQSSVVRPFIIAFSDFSLGFEVVKANLENKGWKVIYLKLSNVLLSKGLIVSKVWFFFFFFITVQIKSSIL